MNKKDVKINVINATELDKTKKYFIELSSEWSYYDANALAEKLRDENIISIIAIRLGDKTISIKEIS